MLYYPLNPEKSFVKRVIAEEGDTVRIVDGRVYVNDIPLQDDYVPAEYRSHDDWGPQVIPEGYYFVMGDHRNNSSDSRHWGMVPKKYIIGKVQLRWWPVPTRACLLSRSACAPERRPRPLRRRRAASCVRVLLLNLGVAVAKIAFGYASGAISILSDGFHSLTDAASNVVGLVGVRAARQPPDEDHPYGHRKYETVAAAAVTVFLLLRRARGAAQRLQPPDRPIGAARDLGRELRRDARHGRRSTCWSCAYESRAARAARQRGAAGRRDADARRRLVVADRDRARSSARGSGLPILDPLAALVVAGFIGYAGYQIARATTGILSDRIVISDADLEQVVMSVPGVLGCHQIRTRGSADHVFLDLHVWLPPDMRARPTRTTCRTSSRTG